MKHLYVLEAAGENIDVCPSCRYIVGDVVVYLRINAQPNLMLHIACSPVGIHNQDELINLAFKPDFKCKCAELEQANRDRMSAVETIITRAKEAAEILKHPTFATPATPDYLENIPQPLTEGATQEMKDKIGFEAPPLYIKPANDEVKE